MREDWSTFFASLDDLRVPAGLREEVDKRRNRPPGPLTTTRRARQIGLTAIAAVGTGAVVALLVVAAHSRSHHAPPDRPAATGQTVTVGSTLQPSTLISSVNWITVNQSNQGSYGVPIGSQWMEVVLKPSAASSHADAIAGYWFASLLGWSDKINASSTGGNDPAGITYAILQPDGSVAGQSLHVLDDAGLVLKDEPSVPTNSLINDVSQTIGALGLSNASIGFVTIGNLGPYPVVSATYSGDAETFLRSHPDAVEELGFGNTPAFLEINDSSGQTVEAVGVIPGAGDTFSWRSASSCDACLPTGSQ